MGSLWIDATDGQQLPWSDYFFDGLDSDWFWANEEPSKHWLDGDLYFEIASDEDGWNNTLLRAAPGPQYSMLVFDRAVGGYNGQNIERVLYEDEDNYCTLKWTGSGGNFTLHENGALTSWTVNETLTNDIGFFGLGFQDGSIHVLMGISDRLSSSEAPIDSLFPVSFTPSYIGFQATGATGDTLYVEEFTLHYFPYVEPPIPTQFTLAQNGELTVSWFPQTAPTPATTINVDIRNSTTGAWISSPDLPGGSTQYTFSNPLCGKLIELKAIRQRDKLPTPGGGVSTPWPIGAAPNPPPVKTLVPRMLSDALDGSSYGADIKVLPSVAAVGSLQERVSETEITYVLDCRGQYVTDKFMVIELLAIQDSGGHEHGSADPAARPIGELEVGPNMSVVDGGTWFGPANKYITGYTGPNGTSFKVKHTWPEMSGKIGVRLYTPEPGSEYEWPDGFAFEIAVTETAYQAKFVELPENPAAYVRLGADCDHPGRFFGTQPFIDSLTSVAIDWRAEYPQELLLGFNDMNLEWGGLFDIGPKRPSCPNAGSSYTRWHPPHKGHRFGINADLQTTGRVSPPERNRLRYQMLGRNHLYVQFPHTNHWHLGSSFVGPPAPPKMVRRHSVPTDLMVAKSPITMTTLATSDSLDVEVSVVACFECVAPGMWTYTYSLENQPTSGSSIQSFGIAPVTLSHSALTTSPEHWDNTQGYQGDSTAFVWNVLDSGSPPPGWVDTGVNVYLGEFNPGPSETVTGFSLTSLAAPDTMSFFVQEWLDLPDTNSTQIVPTLYEHAAIGQTLGPTLSPTGVGDYDFPGGGSIASLRAPSPNPASVRTEIQFILRSASNVVLSIYNAHGRRVRTIRTGYLAAGEHIDVWDGLDDLGKTTASGLYFVHLQAGDTTKTQKLIRLR